MSEREDTMEPAGPAPEPHAMALLGAYREQEDIPSDVKARLWQRLDAEPVAAETSPAARPRRAVWIGLAVAAGVALVLLAPRLAEQTGRRDDSSAAYQGSRLPPVEEAEQSAAVRDDADGGEADIVDTAPAPSEPEAPAEEAGEGEPIEPEPQERGVDRGSSPSKKRHAPKAQPDPAPAAETLGDSLAEETALLGRAQAALSNGKPKQALTALGEHKRKYPDGMLAEERRALMVVALCDSGQVDRGRKQAKRFLAQHPSSGLRDRVAAACPEDDR